MRTPRRAIHLRLSASWLAGALLLLPLASCGTPAWRVRETRPVGASFSDDPGAAAAGPEAAAAPRQETGEGRQERPQEELLRIAARAQRKLGAERLESARARLEALDLDRAWSEAQEALTLLGESPAARELVGRIRLARLARSAPVAPAAPEPGGAEAGDLFRGRLELAGLLLGRGREAEAAEQLRGALRDLRRARERAAREEALRELARALRSSSDEIGREFEGGEYARAGDRVADLLGRVESLPRDPSAAPADGGHPASLDPLVRAIERGDFAAAEEAANAAARSEGERSLLRERIRSLKEALVER